MEKRNFRFKTEFFCINGVYNIPGLVICSGHGYGFETFCCRQCGEIFVIELENFRDKQFSFELIDKEERCPVCNSNLNSSLVTYPEHIFYKGALLKNSEAIDKMHFEDTFIKQAYFLTILK